LPYESGIDTVGDTWGRFGVSFYIYALLFVAFDVEWCSSSCGRSSSEVSAGRLVSMGTFVLVLMLGWPTPGGRES